MQKYIQNQSYVGSSGQTLTTLCESQICHQTHVLCGCTMFGTELKVGPKLICSLRPLQIGQGRSSYRGVGVASSPRLSRGPTSGRNCCASFAFLGSPYQGTKSKKATTPVPSRGPTSGWKCNVGHVLSGVPRRGDKIKRGHITHAFSVAHNWAKVLRNPRVLGAPHKETKPKSGYITHVFSGAHKWAKLLLSPYAHGGPQ